MSEPIARRRRVEFGSAITWQMAVTAALLFSLFGQVRLSGGEIERGEDPPPEEGPREPKGPPAGDGDAPADQSRDGPSPAAGIDLARGAERASFEVRFSRGWVHPPARRRFVRRTRTRIPQDDPLSDALDRAQGAGVAGDPVQVGLVLELDLADARRPRVRILRFQSRYVDDANRDREWALDPRTPELRRTATNIVARLAGAWRLPLVSSHARSMIESQLVAASLPFLVGEDIEVRFSSRGLQAELPRFRRTLEERLPAAFPLAIFPEVEWLLRGAVERIVTPGLERPRRDGTVDLRGIRYKIEKARKVDGVTQVIARGELWRRPDGWAAEESLSFELPSGWLIESRALAVHVPFVGETDRFGSTRWHVKRVALDRVEEPRGDPPEPE